MTAFLLPHGPVRAQGAPLLQCGRLGLDEAQELTGEEHALYITFNFAKFNIMNVSDLLPAAERAAELMRSLSHPQRLLVLCALAETEKSVAALREELGIGQVPMSQQLMRLRADGLVEARREGVSMVYRIARPEVAVIVQALHKTFCADTCADPGARAGLVPDPD